MDGVIKRLVKEKGFGFIRDKNTGKEYFFHHSGLKNINFDELNEGREVTFEGEEGPKGPRAADIYV